MQKVAIVTGGSNGIGAATVKLLTEKGYLVYEFSRHGKAEGAAVRHITTDVSDEASVAASFATVLAETGRLDLLVNNAGFGISGAVEFTTLAEAKKQFDVNFFGTLLCCRAAIPSLRESRGRIINVSSIAASLSIPFQAYYSASKAAINSFSFALANELRPFGIAVSVIMPGDVRSGFTAAREKALLGDELYGGAIDRAVATMEKDERAGMAPIVVAKAIWRAAAAKRPGPLYIAGAKYHLFFFISKILPMRTVNWIIGKMYH